MLLTAVACLAVFGVAIAWAAVVSPAADLLGSATHMEYLIVYTVLGIGLAYVLSRLDVGTVTSLTEPLLIASLAMLAAAQLHLIGFDEGGRTWVEFFGMRIDPGEVAGIAVVLYAAKILAVTRLSRRMALDPTILFLLTGVPCVLFILGASQGTIAVVMFVLLALLVAASARIGNLVLGVLPALFLFALFLLATPFKERRLISFLDPWDDAFGAGFQTAQSLIAVGSGGIFGRGFGESIQRAAYLPGAESEFAFAILGEEFGLLAILAVLLLVSMVAYAGLRAAIAANDLYRALLATGLTALIVVPAIVNAFMVLGMAPVSPVKLPFVSYGPTSALVSFAAVGILLSVMRAPRPTEPGPGQDGNRRQPTHMTKRRVGLVFGICVILIWVASLRGIWIDVFRSGELTAAAAAQQSRLEPNPGQRGTIFDRHGFALAVSRPAFDVAAVTYLVPNHELASRQLAPWLALDPVRLRNLLDAGTGFVYLAHRLPAATAQHIRNLDIDGIDVLPTLRRVHPRGDIATHAVGIVGDEGSGLVGLEALYEGVLGGEDGLRQTVTDGTGRPISIDEVDLKKRGEDMRLTLDAGLQEKVDDALSHIASRRRAKGASAIFIDPRSSEILAIASRPSFDADNLDETDPDFLLDRTIGFDYAPGSIFDPFPIIGALEAGLVEPEEVFKVPSELTIADRVIEDGAAAGEILTTAQILSSSNDVGTALIALRLGPAMLAEWIERFGFGRATGVDLPGERVGTLPEAGGRSVASIGSLAIGRSQTVTPIQLAAAYSAIADEGTLRAPRIVQRIGDRSIDPDPGVQIISPHTAEIALDMLGETGELAAAMPIIDPDTGKYSSDRVVVSAVRLIPTSDPELVEVLVVDQPRTSGSDTSIATEALNAINRFALPYLGIEESP